MAKKQRQEDPPPPGAPDWIVTFSDMISLLVTFFILMMTFSSLDAKESFTLKDAFQGPRGIIDNDHGHSLTAPPRQDLMSAMNGLRGLDTPHSRPPEELPKDLQDVGQQQRDGQLEFDLKGVADGLVIHYGPEFSFGPGSASVRPRLERALMELAEVLRHYQYLVVVEGFTDTEFKPTTLFPTAETLSCARATAAAGILQDGGLEPRLLQLAGLGSQRQLNDNATATKRTANRRIEIRVLSLSRARAETMGAQR
ncbi:MAG: flagellar motor protein MotB [Planctomycetota bacterium]|nr:hypothetical protein [Planctomycetota bacterium]MDP6518718.1 flagellar motor protein MotB [Planctomycetota bacterium]MDP6837758.1 flagellar motor protein MotB [Planctomycetota bacterium]